MLSTSSPSTTSTDWAGLKWNWRHKQTLFDLKETSRDPDSNNRACILTVFLDSRLLDKNINLYCLKVNPEQDTVSSCTVLPRWLAVAILQTKGWSVESVWECVCCVLETLPPFFPRTLMSLARLSRELISRPSLQACKQEITFWVSMRPGRIVRPDRLPWKYWVNLGVATSPPNWRVEWDEEWDMRGVGTIG